MMTQDQQVLGVLPGQGWTHYEGGPVIAWLVVDEGGGQVRPVPLTALDVWDPTKVDHPDRTNDERELAGQAHLERQLRLQSERRQAERMRPPV